MLDAAQLAPHRAVSVRALDVDWVAFSGHKLYAPFGSGVLVSRADWLRDAEPYLAGGGASRTVTRRADGEWTCGGTRPPPATRRLAQRHRRLRDRLRLQGAHRGRLRRARRAGEEALVRAVREGLADVPEVRFLSLFGDDAPRVGVLSFVVDGWNSSHFAAALSAEYGIGVRDGLFCAHPLVREAPGRGHGRDWECGAPEAGR